METLPSTCRIPSSCCRDCTVTVEINQDLYWANDRMCVQLPAIVPIA